MSPYRLRARGALSRGVSGDHLPQGLRWRVIAKTPTVLIEYLFEVLLTSAAVISGGAQVLRLAPSAAIEMLLPDWVIICYAVALLLGAGTTIYGLARKRYGTLVPIGLRLLSISMIAYGLVLLGANGHRSLTPFVMALLLGGITAWRAFILRSTYLLLLRESQPKPGEGDRK